MSEIRKTKQEIIKASCAIMATISELEEGVNGKLSLVSTVKSKDDYGQEITSVAIMGDVLTPELEVALHKEISMRLDALWAELDTLYAGWPCVE